MTGEQCDDGNNVNNDGCAFDCTQEPGYVCTTACLAVCGDETIKGAETCDDGNTAVGDGCNASCQIEVGWDCIGTGPGSCFIKCGDGIKLGTE